MSLFVVPLYVKRKRDKILDNFVRGKIYGFIQANPGTHYNYIKRMLHLNNGAVAYHLGVLEDERLILSRTDGLYKRFYPTEERIPAIDGPGPGGNGNSALGEVLNDTYTHVQLNATQDLIITEIELHPGLTQKELAKNLGKSTQVVNYNINSMAQLGLVKLQRNGNKTKCFVNGIYRVKDTMRDN